MSAFTKGSFDEPFSISIYIPANGSGKALLMGRDLAAAGFTADEIHTILRKEGQL